MATAKKKSSKSKSKSKAKSNKAKGGDMLDDLLGGNVVEKPKKSSSSKKDSADLPDELKDTCDLYVSCKVVEKAIEGKAKLARAKINDYCIDRFCEKWIKTGAKPPTTTYHGEETQFDFTQTSRIDMRPDKIKALKMIGFDAMETDDDGNKKHLTVDSITVNMDVARKEGKEQELLAALKQAMIDVLGEDKIGKAKDILTPNVTFKKTFFESMPTIAKETAKTKEKDSKAAKEEAYIKQLRAMMDIIQPRVQGRGPTSSASDAECFQLVIDADISSGL
jgi:hypothetical protein